MDFTPLYDTIQNSITVRLEKQLTLRQLNFNFFVGSNSYRKLTSENDLFIAEVILLLAIILNTV
jgi:hypothetical protein